MFALRFGAVAAALIAVVALAACSASKSGDESATSGPVSSPASVAASPSRSAEARAALTAVQGYWDYKEKSLADPAAYDEKTAQTWVIADAGDALTRTIASLVQLNEVFRGTLPTARLWVVDDASAGTPPSVTVANCPTATGDWLQRDVQTSRAAPAPTVAGQAPSPWLTT